MHRWMGTLLLAAVSASAANAHAGLPSIDFVAGATTAQTEIERLKAALERQAAALTRAEERIDALEAEGETKEALEEMTLDPGEFRDPLRFYGFFEVGLQRLFLKERSFLHSVFPTETTFLLGSVNLYMDAAPSDSWRVLLEVRLMTYNGSEDFGLLGYELIDGGRREIGVPGYILGSYVVTSALVIERAEIEWAYSDHFTLKAGLWLTPWGIWNVDHGSPTLIPLIAPYFQSYRLYPTQQLGLLASGRWHPLPWEIGYHLGISNGRISGPDILRLPSWPSYDLTDNKMVTGRLYARLRGDTHLAMGASAYWGTSQIPKKQIIDIEPLVLTKGYEAVLKEWGFGLDLSLDIGSLRLRSEFAYTRYFFPNGLRPPTPFYPALGHPDSAQWGWYLVASVMLDLGAVRLEPYLFIDVAWWPAAVAPRDLEIGPAPGINVHFTPEVILKIQYLFSRYIDVKDGGLDFGRFSDDDLHSLSGRLVVSF